MFHLSVVYAGALAADDWEQLSSDVTRDHPEPPSETIGEVELVTYSDATEHREVFAFGG